MMERLTSREAVLVKQIAAANERLTGARQARDAASHELLLREVPAPLSNQDKNPVVGGIVSGLMFSAWWWTRSFSNEVPLLAAAIPIGLSALGLLRAAWRAGRVAGARGLQ